jgi:arylsulfatase A-like enzyme
MACRNASGTTMPIAWARPLFVPTANTPAPLVVIVSLDTLRADRVSGFGAAAGATPVLGRLGREGVRFIETMAEATWTIPSHFALFYSRLYGFPAERPPLRGLPQVLADHGYVTAGFTGGGFMGAFFRFHLGFDHFAEYDAHDFGGSDVRSLPHVLDDAERWMRTFSDVPLAMFVHTYAVHELTPGEQTFREERPDRPLGEQFDPSPAQVAAARRLYDELVVETDTILGPFFERLRAVAAERPLLLIVLSDHGEAFWEHQNYRHGDDGPRVTLHDEVTRVPLIVWGPKIVAEGVVSRRPTMLIDVAPSILAAAGIPRPTTMMGQDIWSSWSLATAGGDDGAGAGAPSVSRGARGWALRSRSYKLIAEAVDGAPTRFELYDLRRDPQERRNLAARNRRATEALRWRLTRRVAGLTGTPLAVELPVCPLCKYEDMEAFWDGALMQAAGGDREAIEAATRERLRALGYAEP